MGFKDYKIRGDKLIPNDAYRKGWNEIFGKKKKVKKEKSEYDWNAYEYYDTEKRIQKENEEYLKEIEPLFKGDN
jgi:hypothetical protein|tara:strand:+ start:6594 stop:6815 length:222 start_codon:yes stop_codon:yes gene_type:complete